MNEVASCYHSPSAKLSELFLGHTDNLSRIHLRGSLPDLFIVDPVVGVIQASEQQDGSNSALWFGVQPQILEFG